MFILPRIQLHRGLELKFVFNFYYIYKYNKSCFSIICISIRQKFKNIKIFPQIINIIAKNPWLFRVKLMQKRFNGALKTVPGNLLALAEPSKVLIPVRSRVVAIFHDVNSSNYYSGIIAEPPKSTNKFR